jgi:hypothetical protein
VAILSQNLAMPRETTSAKTLKSGAFRMCLIPCSCGTSFAVSLDYDRHGSAWSRYLSCPNCGKRHDPKNRLLELVYNSSGYWKVDKC